MNKLSARSLFFGVLLAALVCAVYGSGLNNQLLFDDARLGDGTIFEQYGSLAPQIRSLSYGSFVWLQSLFGEGWWKQRLFNLFCHMGTCAVVYTLGKDLLERTTYPEEMKAAPQFEQSRMAALQFGTVLFALNPVAVYAVAYLIQRSVVMAAFFVALACLSWVRCLSRNSKLWLGIAMLAYVLAVFSKEYAVTAAALALPLYVFVRRPTGRQIVLIAGAAALVLGIGALLLSLRYPDVLGQLFDETSKAYARQLETLSPGVTGKVWALSIANQMGLFFRYGLLWLIPNVGWMSIDLRPAFPLSLLSVEALTSILAYLGLLAASAWLVVRRSDVLGLIGLCLLFPLLMFGTEFSTVWIQDPFVLYRSYLWALSLPVLVALPLIGFKTRLIYPATVLLALLLAGLGFERVQSLSEPQSAWADAAAKIDLKAPANAVGRWRPFLNMGSTQLERDENQEALRLFTLAAQLGEPLGSARFSMAMSYIQMKQPALALAQLQQAEAMGFQEAALYFQRGEILYNQGKFAAALRSYAQALNKPQSELEQELSRRRHAEAAVASGEYDTAIAGYQSLLQQKPDSVRNLVGLSMAHIGKNEAPKAIEILNPLIDKRPTAQAFYARALAQHYLGQNGAAQKDIDIALRAEPRNPIYLALKTELAAGKASPKK